MSLLQESYIKYYQYRHISTLNTKQQAITSKMTKGICQPIHLHIAIRVRSTCNSNPNSLKNIIDPRVYHMVKKA